MNPNEQKKHETVKTVLKIVGILVLAGGGILTVAGLIDFVTATSGFESPTRFWMLMLGLPMLGIGGMITMLGFRREIGRYMKNEAAPVLNEMSEELRPGVKNIASAVREGMEGGVRCSCGTVNPAGSRFCTSCGKALTRVCSGCGRELPSDANFCPYCGKKAE